MKTKIIKYKRYISPAERLEYHKLSRKNRKIIDPKFYESAIEKRRAKWDWLYTDPEGIRYRRLQFKKACHNIARISRASTLSRDIDEHIISMYEIEQRVPRGFSVFNEDRTPIQAQIFNQWIKTPEGSNWRELKRNLGMIYRGKLKRCKIEIRARNSRILTYKKDWDHTVDGNTGFNNYKSRKGKHNLQSWGSKKGDK